MDAGELHRLARVLRHLAASATSDAGEDVSPAEALVGMDVFTHSPTTVTDVSRRTGVAQSQVSKVTAEMQAMGILTATKDPHDARRTLLALDPRASRQYGARRGLRDPGPAVERHLADLGRPHGERQVGRVLRLLDELADALGVSSGEGQP